MEQNASQKILSRLSKIILYIFAGAIGISLILLAAILIWYATLDVEQYRDRIESSLSKNLGRDIHIAGKIELKGILAPHLVAEKISIKNVSWGSVPEFARAERFEIEVELFSLLRDDVKIQELTLVGAKLQLERNDKGVPNWLTDQAEAPTTDEAAIPDITLLTIEDSIIFHLVKDRPPVTIKIKTVQANLSKHLPVSLQGKLAYENLPVEFNIQAESLHKLIVQKQTWPIQGDILFDRYPLKLEGSVTDPVALKELQLRLTTQDNNQQRTIFEGDNTYKVSELGVDLRLRAIEDKHELHLTAVGKKLDLKKKVATNKKDSSGFRIMLDSLNTEIKGSGKNINEIIENSSIHFLAQNGEIYLPSKKHDAGKMVLIKRVEGNAKPRQKFISEIDIQYNKKKINLELVYGRLINLVWGEEPWPIKVNIKTDDLKGSLDGKIEHSETSKKITASIKSRAKHSSINLNGVEFDLKDKEGLFSENLLKADWTLSVAKGLVQYWESEVQPTVHNIDISNVAVTGSKRDITYSLNAKNEGVTARFSGKTISLDSLLNEDKPFPIDLDVNGKALTARADLLFNKPFDNFSISGKYKINIKEPNKIGLLFNQDWQWQHPISAKGLFNYSNKVRDFVLDKTNLKTLGTDIHGSVKYLPGTTPEVSIDIQRADLDLASYIEKEKPVLDNMIEEEVTDNKAIEKPARVIPDISFDRERLKPWSITANISNFRIFSAKEHLVTIKSRVSLVNSILSVSGFESRNLAGSSSTGSLLMDASGDIPRATISTTTKNLDYGQLLQVTGVSDLVSGHVDLNINLEGQGKNLTEFLANSDGQLEFVSDKGRIPRKLLEIWGGGLLRIFLPTTWVGEDTTDLNCAVGRFTVKQGMMNSDVLLADTKNVTVAGDLKVNFETEQISGLIKSKPKSVALFRIKAPIKVSGTLAQPDVGTADKGIVGLGKLFIGLVDPTAMLVVFTELGSKEKNPCAALLEQKQ